MDILYTTTSITLGNGSKTPFWHVPWLDGRKSKDIAPKIFSISKIKKLSTNQAMHEGACNGKVSWDPNFYMEHPTQFCGVTYGFFYTMYNFMIVWRMTSHGSLR
jgi:hypothetical protein